MHTKELLCIGHRGAMGHAPENTLLSIRKALALGTPCMEMDVYNVDDVLARRTRSLLLNARAARQAAPKVASIMAKELEKDHQWEKEQIESFHKISKLYLMLS